MAAQETNRGTLLRAENLTIR
ncbi:MAG: hypothetical protein RI953_2991, partial [Pseudomonadota bacterium]